MAGVDAAAATAPAKIVKVVVPTKQTVAATPIRKLAKIHIFKKAKATKAGKGLASSRVCARAAHQQGR